MTPSTSAPDTQVVAALPHVFVDRSLGAIQLPRLLRAAGIQLTTMREHYGEQLGQMTIDPTGSPSSPSAAGSDSTRTPPFAVNDLERAAVRRSGARLFCVPRADITADGLAHRYLDNLAAIARVTAQPGPYIYGVYPNEIKQLPLD